jgi:Fe(II)/alpha-ketoglutarate-dependent arginine beta-hydroxylase
MKIELAPQELDELYTLVAKVRSQFTSFEDSDFLITLHEHARRLPSRIYRELNQFKYKPGPRARLLIDGLPINDAALGPTPAKWGGEDTVSRCLDQCLVACLYSAVLGDLFAWSTQQDGKVIHDVFPIRKDENEQLGTGSLQDISWHIEDAFHEFRGDYCAFFCLRNPDNVPTTVGTPDFSQLTDDELDELFTPQFLIKPDNSHLPQHESESRRLARIEQQSEVIEHSYQQMVLRRSEPESIAVLFGNRSEPFIRIDPYFMSTPSQAKAAAALAKLIQLIEDAIEDAVLQPGEIMLMDNYRMVHGRRKFKPRYDGTDRWFKRINITRDLRRSAAMRSRIESHVML